jgi:hypothetical protein
MKRTPSTKKKRDALNSIFSIYRFKERDLKQLITFLYPSTSMFYLFIKEYIFCLLRHILYSNIGKPSKPNCMEKLPKMLFRESKMGYILY